MAIIRTAVVCVRVWREKVTRRLGKHSTYWAKADSQYVSLNGAHSVLDIALTYIIQTQSTHDHPSHTAILSFVTFFWVLQPAGDCAIQAFMITAAIGADPRGPLRFRHPALGMIRLFFVNYSGHCSLFTPPGRVTKIILSAESVL